MTDIARPERLELRLPPDPEAIATARLFAAATARRIGFGEDEIDDIRLGISEGVTNAIRAHLASGISDPVTLVALVSPESITYEVIDNGPGFDPDNIQPDPDINGRYGLAVMRSLFVDATVARNEDRGMTLRFSVKATAAESR